jgi:acrylyl-CoA reductase (NADPH)
MFKALYLNKENHHFSASIKNLPEEALPSEGDVLIEVSYSTLNYKDGLAITNTGPIVRKWPMVPGIDLAGTVITSTHPQFSVGDQVLLNGWGVGESHWGGLAQKARLKGEWLIHLPATLTPKQAMAIGTAGYTAMLSILALEKHGITPAKGEILVTGASGGVGSIAITLLKTLGYTVVASTGKLSETDYLTSLGAAEVIDRQSLAEAGRPLQQERYAGVIDSLGSHTLANACAQTKANGAVAACGLAQGMEFPATVMPFILRGVTLYGINSVTVPIPLRIAAWERLAKDLDRVKLDNMTKEIPLASTIAAASQLIAGKITGRLVINVNA